MPARFLNDEDITSLRRGGIQMTDIPIITGERFEGLTESKPLQTSKYTLHSIQTSLRQLLNHVMSGLQIVWNTRSFQSLSDKQLISVAFFFGVLAIFQVYLSIP